MYCIQCEQTMRNPAGDGCKYEVGVCGKTAETSDLQDLLIAALQSLSAWALKAREFGIIDRDIDAFTHKAFFSTLTNVNFDSARIIDYARQTITYRDSLIERCHEQEPEIKLNHPLATLKFNDLGGIQGLRAQAAQFALDQGLLMDGPDIHGLRMLCLYGLKGAAAYMEHAHVLGQIDDEVCAGLHHYLAWLGTSPEDVDELVNAALGIGQLNFKIMEMLDTGATTTYGHPQPAQVNVRPIAGKAILISGHDLKDLRMLLEQTAGKGINVYTHGEMLPAHGYPELKKYPHLAGNYGSGWQNQQTEFAEFPGPVLMTSNCIIDPTPGQYTDRIWTRSIVGWPGVKHLEGEDFALLIEQALAMPGFTESEPEHLITVGFGRQVLLSAADTVIDMVAQKKLRHVFLIGGCDGARPGRNYYTDIAEAVPQDCITLTLGCGKYRFNKLDFGYIDGLPRLLDVGQCNDAYSAVMLAVKLSEKLGCTVNDLPLTLVLSWFEQKAIVILLTLLSLGVKNIYTGPTAPGFLTDNLLAVLEDKFALRMTTTVEQDMQEILAA